LAPIGSCNLNNTLIEDFANNLDLINTLAERSPGFVWRLKGDNNNATDFQFGDELSIVNMWVWESTVVERKEKSMRSYHSGINLNETTNKKPHYGAFCSWSHLATWDFWASSHNDF